MPEGRQSPPPERQTGAQQQAPPASGKGTDNAENKGEKIKSELEVRPKLIPLLLPILSLDIWKNMH